MALCPQRNEQMVSTQSSTRNQLISFMLCPHFLKVHVFQVGHCVMASRNWAWHSDKRATQIRWIVCEEPRDPTSMPLANEKHDTGILQIGKPWYSPSKIRATCLLPSRLCCWLSVWSYQDWTPYPKLQRLCRCISLCWVLRSLPSHHWSKGFSWWPPTLPLIPSLCESSKCKSWFFQIFEESGEF